MQKLDIREHKRSLRDSLKKMRQEMSADEKIKKDEQILQRVKTVYQYKKAQTILCYMSTPIEIDTRQLIIDAWDQGKKVAVPKCLDNRKMVFYTIKNFDQLEKGVFGIMEPKGSECEILAEFKGAVCIVPALAYDFDGYRLGYGGGYYDRFLSANMMLKIGVAYSRFVRPRLVRGRYDVPVDLIVTEKYLRITGKRFGSGTRFR